MGGSVPVARRRLRLGGGVGGSVLVVTQAQYIGLGSGVGYFEVPQGSRSTEWRSSKVEVEVKGRD